MLEIGHIDGHAPRVETAVSSLPYARSGKNLFNAQVTMDSQLVSMPGEIFHSRLRPDLAERLIATPRPLAARRS